MRSRGGCLSLSRVGLSHAVRERRGWPARFFRGGISRRPGGGAWNGTGRKSSVLSWSWFLARPYGRAFDLIAAESIWTKLGHPHLHRRTSRRRSSGSDQVGAVFATLLDAPQEAPRVSPPGDTVVCVVGRAKRGLTAFSAAIIKSKSKTETLCSRLRVFGST